jgi:hypothetical protein
MLVSNRVEKVLFAWSAIGFLLITVPPAVATCQELPELEAETESEDLAELLSYLQDNPINLNRATAEELMLIPWLSPAQALRLHQYLKGRPASDPSRLATEGIIDQDTWKKILPYIYIEGRPGSPVRPSLSSLWQRSWPAQAVSESEPWSHRQRLERWKPDGWSAFLQTQKDRGESNWLDFWSGAAGYRDPRGRFQLLAGDFQIRIGLGLIFGGTGPRFLYPGCFPKTAVPAAAAIHTSSSEWSALRGGAAWGRLGSFRMLVAASQRRIDGRIDSTGTLWHIYQDGYHRTDQELARKHNASEQMGVLYLGWEPISLGWMGAAAYACDYDPPFAESLSIKSGASLSGGLAGSPGYVSFELAATEQKAGALSALAGARAWGTEASLLAYFYQPGYRSPRFNAYERYGGSDEQGAAVFQKSSLPLRTSLSTLFHWYRPWSASAAVDKGHGGFLLDLKVDNDIINHLNAGCRFRLKEAEKPCQSEEEILLGRERYSLTKIMLDWTMAGGWIVSSDYAASRFQPASGGGGEKGEMLSAGVGWKERSGLYMCAQSSFFRTDSYGAAIYQNEPELKSTGSFHPLFGSGRRDALLVRYAYAKRLSAEFKLAYTYREYQGETVRQPELGMQIEIK